ncbi:MAG TPA: cyclic nucleotide-binding domain-containing protein [Anaerolineales bacterium]|nr:cyclic nucleotide-binding domain-containing protein [Anaerolineales bacterium]
MDLISQLSKVELFDGLTEDELSQVASICRERVFHPGEVITQQGESGDELFVVTEGLVEVLLGGPQAERKPRAVVNLGQGQIIGEMALVDHGPRSATVRALTDPTLVQAVSIEDFEGLFEDNHHLGFIIMRNMASDLSFKLRHQHLAGR